MNENIYIEFSRYTQPILILLGTVGALFNQILFRRRKLIKKASSTIYLRALSINDLLFLYCIVLTQWINDQFQWDPSSKYIWYCKIRTYARFTLYAISPYCIGLVCFDRLYRTSEYTFLRKIATPCRAHKLIIITILIVLLTYIHVPFQYSIYRSKCFPSNVPYYHMLGYFIFIFYCLLPPVLMSIFSSWTLILLHRYRRKQERKYQLRTIFRSKRRCDRNYQLMKILFLYVTTNIICTLPFSILMLLYTHQLNSNRQLLVYIKTTVLLCNVNHCTSFYIYIH